MPKPSLLTLEALRLLRDLNRDLIRAGETGPYGPATTQPQAIAGITELIGLTKALLRVDIATD